MRTKRLNESYYQYRASCRIRRDDGSEEIKNYELETDILYGDLYFWNRLYYLKQSQNLLFDLARQDVGIVKCRILQEELVLLPRFTYKSDKICQKKGIGIRKILLIIEMIILILLNMTRPSMAEEFNRNVLKNSGEVNVHLKAGNFMHFQDHN
ncbi:hypothetical protein AALB39_03240 [Lachnospiraceae bacterium 54-53]